MIKEVKLSKLDLRFQSYRMKHSVLEGRLLDSIAQQGILEPLEGAEAQEGSVLLNGFKRYRCARKLAIEMAPYSSLGPDSASGIIGLLTASTPRGLSILEQAGFVEELNKRQMLSVGQIAQELGRSKSWVSMRLGLFTEMSPKVRQKLLEGSFLSLLVYVPFASVHAYERGGQGAD